MDAFGSISAVRNGPNDERLAAFAIAGGEDVVYGSLLFFAHGDDVIFIGFNAKIVKK